jgi:aspartyl-tRNA(Asn)/glutamyl-tRNA(Gln) amidotransferase subunit A
VGIKPTYGRVSRWGVVAFASSLDQAGPMTKSVRDASIMLEAMASHDRKDSTSSNFPVPNFEAALTGDIKGKKIGIPNEYRMDGMSEEIEKLWSIGAEMLRDSGAIVVDVNLPHTKYALPVYYVLAPAEASSNLARYDGVRYGHRAKLKVNDNIDEMYSKTRAEGFGKEVQRRIMIGTYVLSAGFYDAYYRKAQRVRTLIKRDFDKVFDDGVDAILTPTTPSSAFPLGEMNSKNPIEMYLNDIFTVTVNLAGLPGISVPAGIDVDGMPLGLQLIGKPWDEGELLNTAFVLEKALKFSDKPKKWW